MAKKTRDEKPAPSLLVCERREVEGSENLELSCVPFVQVGDVETEETPGKKSK